ncbi:MAG TPA: non-homologous end-joining DNA ligase [Gemmatimonadaceae bacterium]|nr:non-homologous end-joining DNA ligase [Gemmatimonadaceae bacterium]
MGRRELPKGSELFQPMLASPGKEAPRGEQWVFEPKYDGIRIVAIALDGAVALMTRNGHDKCRQFPEVTAALRELGAKTRRALVLDGEIVALDARGEPSRFQDLQGRMHLTDMGAVSTISTETPAAFIAFDILVDGDNAMHGETWDDRRKTLELVMRKVPARARPLLRISTVAYGAADALIADAHAHGWEGIMAKRRDCPYEAGSRVRHWQKIKIENEQEFVIGGWTEPRNSRKHFGALLLGYYDDDGQLVYAGHTGTGFSDQLLDTVYRKLVAIERTSSPFTNTPVTNQPAHWTKPVYVAQVRFNEWTAGGHLRQPVFVGFRDDKDAREVLREGPSALGVELAADGPRRSDKAVREVRVAAAARKTPARKAPGKKRSAGSGASKAAGPKPRAESREPRAAKPKAVKAANLVAEQLRLAPAAKNATVHIDRNTTLDITNLGKVFFPAAKVTKGRLMEYYAEVAPYLLPALEDRPLVLKRYPNGINADAFYQQKAPDKVPPGIRVEEVADDGITTQRRLIGGDLTTLLYIVQLGAVSTDPWHSRVQSIADADYSIVDLDPGPKATFKRVISVARWVKEVLDEFGLHAVPKTSGASGIHIVLPLPRGAGYDVSVTLAELVARRVNEKHPKETTVVRAVKARPADAVYVDYLQNIRGKTVASVYSARAETHASVSTPLKWNELTDDLTPEDFTVTNMLQRLKKMGDLWGDGMKRVNRLPGITGDAAA